MSSRWTSAPASSSDFQKNDYRSSTLTRRNWFFLAELAMAKISEDAFIDSVDIGVVRLPKLFSNLGLTSAFIEAVFMS